MNTTYGKPNRENNITFGYIVLGNNGMKPRYFTKVTTTAWQVLVMVLKLVLLKAGTSFLKRITPKMKKIGRRNRTARSLEVSVLFGATRGSKACQMAPTMEPKIEQIPTNRFGMRFVSILETTRLQNARQIGSQLHITWKRLNM